MRECTRECILGYTTRVGIPLPATRVGIPLPATKVGCSSCTMVGMLLLHHGGYVPPGVVSTGCTSGCCQHRVYLRVLFLGSP